MKKKNTTFANERSVLLIDAEHCRIEKLAGFLIVLSMTSQDLSVKRFQFVPIQDFTSKSDIVWNKSISEMEQQLYTKYHLTDKEIGFIEKMIKSI